MKAAVPEEILTDEEEHAIEPKDGLGHCSAAHDAGRRRTSGAQAVTIQPSIGSIAAGNP